MRKTLLAGAAGLALILAPAAISQISFQPAAAVGQTGAMTYDANRGVLTMAPLLEKVTPAVVSIETSGKASSKSMPSDQQELLERFFGGRMPQQNSRPRGSLGSGVIVDAGKGYIITNHHVIDGAEDIYVTLEDRREIEATLVGSDPKTDIAILEIDAQNLTALKLASSRSVKVGDYVIAVGNPFGLSSTVTSGIVSALGRESGRGDGYQDYIQTDAAINQGNSGGALVNSKGELIGINTAILSRSGGSNGIGFAVPTKMIKGVMGQLVEFGEVKRGRIGITISDIDADLQEALKLTVREGALINSVSEDSPADKAGLKAGDVVVGFNGEIIYDASDIRNEVGLVQPGQRTDISYIRDGRKRTTRILVEEVEEERVVLDDSAADDIPAMESFSGAEIIDIPKDVNPRGGDAGVYVSTVQSGSKAARAGLRTGDIIREVDRREISDLGDFEDAIADKEGVLALTIEREGTNLFIAVR